MPKKDLKESFEHPSVVGLVSDDLNEPKNKALQKRFMRRFKELKIPCVYLLLKTERRHLKNLLLCMRLMDIVGVNVADRFQKAVIPYLTSLDESAKHAKRVNTIVRVKKGFKGYYCPDTVSDSLRLWSSVF